MRTNYLQRVLDNQETPHKFHNPLWERAAGIARQVDAEMGFRSDIPPGLEILTGGGALTLTQVNAAITAGYVGIYLDPRYVWTISSTLVIFGISNFVIESRMGGGMQSGGTGTFPTTPVYNTNGYISTSISTVTVASCVLNGTTTVTVASGGFPGVTVGNTVSGTDIPTTNGATVYVLAIVGNSMTLSQAATGSTTTTLTFGSDGFQIYGAASGATTTTSVVLRNLAFVGANPQSAVVHVANNATNCVLERCFIYNTSATTNSYGLVIDSGLLASGPTEDNLIDNCSIAGAWVAVGISVGDTANKANDMEWFNLNTYGGGPYSVIAAAGGNHQFHQFYDRSEPTTATVWNQGAVLIFYGGEDLNAGTGSTHAVSGGVTVLVDRSISFITGATATVAITGGTMVFQGRGSWNGAATMTIATGTVDMSGGAWNNTNCTITGSTGTLILPDNFGPTSGALPNYSAYTGTVVNSIQAVSPAPFGHAVTGTRGPAYTPPSGYNAYVRVTVWIHATTVTTSVIPTLTYTDTTGASGPATGTAVSAVVPMQKLGSATAPVVSITTTGTYTGVVYLATDQSATQVKVSIVPTSATYDYTVAFEVLGLV